MTDREKLVKLLSNVEFQYTEIHSVTTENVAGYLISKGLTFAKDTNAINKWIPVSDPPKEPNEYIVMIKGGGSATALLYDGEKWFEVQEDEQVCYHVTHWMPLPEPPKGE